MLEDDEKDCGVCDSPVYEDATLRSFVVWAVPDSCDFVFEIWDDVITLHC